MIRQYQVVDVDRHGVEMTFMRPLMMADGLSDLEIIDYLKSDEGNLLNPTYTYGYVLRRYGGTIEVLDGWQQDVLYRLVRG